MLCVPGHTHHCLSDVCDLPTENISVPVIILFLFFLLLFAVPMFDLSSVGHSMLEALEIET